ncbi:unnamed protein product [Ranitomeya imitator]|uniref:Reverse transcriptase domain-containing protein n=1 Tax=Ranitomeya imitator TaxID=111125 RepID=A0ABN9L4N9_9NEOB|nr:unnamed protein product [Ranitomeya imitator]
MVVMDRSMNREEILTQLQNRTVYSPLSHNPSSAIESKIKPSILASLIKKTQAFLIKSDAMIPVFYTLPKIHRGLDRTPGRPIVASTNSILSPLAILLEKILTPLVKNIPSFILDTGAFLNVIRTINRVTSDTILVTLDVNNLYTSVEHEKGIRATRLLLEKTDMDAMVIDFLMKLLKLVLTENFFLFEDTFYLQVQGTDMGSNVAPPMPIHSCLTLKMNLYIPIYCISHNVV